jgi:predicted N-acetyltransferase YhbS/Pyruvate/2-oxoacid:ferredoxin oxidoreductase delta subunit
VLDFIRRFPDGKNRAVLMNTRGGVRIGRIVTPGLTGIAFILSSIILRKKGYKIIGQIPFDMPSNWISIHPALHKKSVEFIFEKNYEHAKKHFEKLYAGKTDFSARKDIVQDILIFPVAIAYYFVGRYFLAKSFYASYKCTNCNLCVKECPVKAIETIDQRPFWTFKCESCMKCINHCPARAIEITHGLWVAVLLPCLVLHWSVAFLIYSVLLLGLIVLLYKIQHHLLKNRILAKIISFTSMTYYKFWGRYRNKEMNLKLRPETAADYKIVEELTREAFWNIHVPGCNEHLLIHNLRNAKEFVKPLDFVAVYNDKIVGNIVYAKAKVKNDSTEHTVLTFGPLSVLPEYQNMGIGSELINHTVKISKEMGYKAVLIYGDPEYYKRFGFKESKVYEITNKEKKYPAALLALELYPNALNEINGIFDEGKAYEINEKDAEEFDRGFCVKEKVVRKTQERFLELVNKYL